MLEVELREIVHQLTIEWQLCSMLHDQVRALMSSLCMYYMYTVHYLHTRRHTHRHRHTHTQTHRHTDTHRHTHTHTHTHTFTVHANMTFTVLWWAQTAQHIEGSSHEVREEQTGQHRAGAVAQTIRAVAWTTERSGNWTDQDAGHYCTVEQADWLPPG